MTVYAVSDGLARFNSIWAEYSYDQFGTGYVAEYDNIYETPPPTMVYVTDIPISDEFPSEGPAEQWAAEFVAYYDAAFYTSEQPRTYRSSPIVSTYTLGAQQIISLTSPSVITNNYKTRWKFRTSSVDRPLEYQNMMVKWHAYMLYVWNIGIYEYFMTSLQAAQGWLYEVEGTFRQNPYGTAEEHAYIGGFTNGDEWQIRFDGSGTAVLRGFPGGDWQGGIGAAIYADFDDDPFEIEADTWYILEYEAGEIEDPDGLGGYARFTLCLANGDEPGAGVAEVIYQRDPPTQTTMIYGDGEVISEGYLYAPGASLTDAPSSSIIIDGHSMFIIYIEDDEHLYFYSDTYDYTLLSGEVEWTIPGTGPDRVGIQGSAQLFSDPFTVDWDWVQVCVGEESIVYPGAATSGVTYTSEEPGATGVYVTTYPYQSGTLKLYDQGTLLRPGSDFVELEPANGTFRVYNSQDLSGSLRATYTRYGSGILLGTGGTVYRPPVILQYGWGTRFDGYNCTMACSAMALARHTNGGIITTPPQHRSNQDDQVGGTDLYDVAVAWSRGWDQAFAYTVSDWGALVQKLNEGRGVILQGDYGALPADKRFSSSYTGGHAIYLNEQFSNGYIWGADPLYKYPCVYTPEELIAYAHGMVINGETGRVSFGYTRVTT